MTNDDIAAAWVLGVLPVRADAVSPETEADALDAANRFYAQRSVTVRPTSWSTRRYPMKGFAQ